jgi:hypothetical protein
MSTCRQEVCFHITTRDPVGWLVTYEDRLRQIAEAHGAVLVDISSEPSNYGHAVFVLVLEGNERAIDAAINALLAREVTEELGLVQMNL